jgi:DNA-binding CsgD family transcriptional regulator
MLAGEPGIGKSRLLDEAAALASAAAVTVLRGGASEAEGMPPYLPFVEALGRYVRMAPLEPLRREAGPWAGVLAGILPELVLRLGELPPLPMLPQDQARLRLFDAVGEILAAMAADAPVVLLFDDLQWADPASLDLLLHLARSFGSGRIGVVGAFRAGELRNNPALERLLDDLTRLRALTEIPVEPLSLRETASLVRGVLGAEADAAVGRRLHEESEGNPFFAEELLRGWQESGGLHLEDGRWVLVPPSWDEDQAKTIPPTIAGAVRRRLGRLEPDVLEHLKTAAIAGRSFSATLVAAVEEQDEETVEQGLLRAADAGLLRADGRGNFRFRHDRVRECVYGDITSARRTRLHAAIGRWLEDLPGLPDAQRLADLAFHFARSGDRERGARYSVQAAEGALAAFAPVEAVRHYRVALNLSDQDAAERGDLLLALGRAALPAAMEEDAVAAFETAQRLFARAGDHLGAARAAHGAGQARWRLEQTAPAKAAFESALALLQGYASPETAAVLIDFADLVAVSFGEPQEAVEYSRRALEIARQAGDVKLQAAAARTMGNLLVRINQLDEGIAQLEGALALARTTGDPADVAQVYSYLMMAYGWQGNVARFQAMIDDWLDAAERSRDVYLSRHLYSMLVVEAGMLGEWALARRRVETARAAIERVSSPEPHAFLDSLDGWIAWCTGDFPRAELLLERSIAQFRAIGPQALVWYLGLLGLLYVARGRRTQAVALMNELEELMAALPAGSMQRAEPVTFLAQVALQLDERERLERYHPILLAFSGQFHDFAIDRLLGEIEIRRGRYDEAERHLRAATQLTSSAGLRPEHARTLAARAILARVRHERDAADQLSHAVARFDALGLVPDAQWMRAQYDLQPERTHAATASGLPAGLSPREAEVLALVAGGRSNREIAETLVLSERTVANHLTSIFNKLGCENRAAATAWAIRNGIA